MEKDGIIAFRILGLLIVGYLALACLVFVYTGDIALPERNSQYIDVPQRINVPQTDDLEKTIPETNSPGNFDLSEKNQDSPPNAVEYYNQTYTWKHDGYESEYFIGIPKEYYDYYKSQPHSSRKFENYALSDKDRPVLRQMVATFKEQGDKRNYTDDQNVMNIIAFIQDMPYTSDYITTGYDEYPRYPIETLVDGGGDCEDSAILAAALLSEMGYGTVLLEFPNHLALGVAGGEGIIGSYYEYKGVKYYYVETTASGYGIGEIPEEIDASTTKIHPMKK
jgi:Predicted periplasmic protein